MKRTVQVPFRPRPQGEGQTVALVLGSGGARGYAHIGVIEVLLERGYEIIAIAGCSMGAVIGGVYAAGKLQAYKDWVTGLGQFDVLKLLDISFSAPGAIRGEKVFSIVHDLIGDVRIEELPLAFTAVATDLLAHKEIWFQEGPLHQAIRASAAIPSLLTPVLMGGRVLVDGGLMNPLPIIPTISSHADRIIAVNLSGEDIEPLYPIAPQPQAGTSAATDEWLGALKEKASRWLDWDTWRSLPGRHQGNVGETPPSEPLTEAGNPGGGEMSLPGNGEVAEPTRRGPAVASPQVTEDKAEALSWERLGLGKFDIMNLTFETMQTVLTQYKLAGYPPDVRIDIPKHACKTFDYHKAPELIQLGRERTEAALDRLFPPGHGG